MTNDLSPYNYGSRMSFGQMNYIYYSYIIGTFGRKVFFYVKLFFILLQNKKYTMKLFLKI